MASTVVTLQMHYGGCFLLDPELRKIALQLELQMLLQLQLEIQVQSGTVDRVLHSPTLKSSIPTNIDLGYKPNGLRWKGGAAVTQRQLQQESYKRVNSSTSTHATTNTQSTITYATPAVKITSSTQDT